MEFRGTVARDETGKPIRLDGVAGDVTERRRNEERQRELMNELNHRVQNTLAVVQALAAQTSRSASSTDEFKAAFTARVAALAATHDLLTHAHWDGVSLQSVLEAEMRAFQDAVRPRIRLSGPGVVLPPRMVTPIGLIVHELTTNAVKYGSLSSEDGEVSVVWSVSKGGQTRLHLSWHEQDGPPVIQPGTLGFGSRLIDRTIRGELNGTVESQYLPDGLRVRIDAPLETKNLVLQEDGGVRLAG